MATRLWAFRNLTSTGCQWKSGQEYVPSALCLLIENYSDELWEGVNPRPLWSCGKGALLAAQEGYRLMQWGTVQNTVDSASPLGFPDGRRPFCKLNTPQSSGLSRADPHEREPQANSRVTFAVPDLPRTESSFHVQTLDGSFPLVLLQRSII